jgi:tetratricopeptide (TPR) repeat protein
MASIEDLPTYIQNFRSELAARRYDEALTLYYAQIDKPLYWSGQNQRIVELLGSFLGRDNKPLTSIDRSLQERLSRSLGEAYRITGQPNNSIALLQWLLDSYNDKHNHRIRAIILRYLSRIMLSLGQLKIAEEHIIAGIELCREAADFGLETGLHRQLGILFTYAGRYKEARTEIASLPKSFGKHSHSDFSEENKRGRVYFLTQEPGNN